MGSTCILLTLNETRMKMKKKIIKLGADLGSFPEGGGRREFSLGPHLKLKKTLSSSKLKHILMNQREGIFFLGG